MTNQPSNHPSDYSPLLESISLLNNHGVQLLDDGQYDAALTAFTNALDHLRPLIGSVQRISQSSDQILIMDIDSSCDGRGLRSGSNPHYSVRSGRQTYPSTECSSAQRTWRPTSTKHSKDEFNELFVFRDAITIPLEVAKSEVNYRFLSKLSMVIMFNLALAFHSSALLHSSLSRLMRAKTLYEFAFQMHLDENTDVTLLYSLALMNNMGLIYRALGQESRSNECFEYLLSTMMFLVESNEAHLIKQWEGLFSNIVDLIIPGADVVAPAA